MENNHALSVAVGLRPDLVLAIDWKVIFPEGCDRYDVRISDADNGWLQVIALIFGPSKEAALTAACAVLATLGAGREVRIRMAPEADSHKDFSANEWLHKGYVRFSVRDGCTRWHAPEPPDERTFRFGPGDATG